MDRARIGRIAIGRRGGVSPPAQGRGESCQRIKPIPMGRERIERITERIAIGRRGGVSPPAQGIWPRVIAPTRAGEGESCQRIFGTD